MVWQPLSLQCGARVQQSAPRDLRGAGSTQAPEHSTLLSQRKLFQSSGIIPLPSLPTHGLSAASWSTGSVRQMGVCVEVWGNCKPLLPVDQDLEQGLSSPGRASLAKPDDFQTKEALLEPAGTCMVPFFCKPFHDKKKKKPCILKAHCVSICLSWEAEQGQRGPVA